ncbi:MAG: ABC transporter ATP-binding protein [Nitrosomonas sp.]|nr:MAG: ABC transporter ATP-binding protein [Nitrosomonas sp.]
MFSNFNHPGTAIQISQASKCYQLYHRPAERLKQFLWPHRWLGARQFYREFWALRDINLCIQPGEVVGIVGRNGAGKSTLLQLVCGTLQPTQGEISVTGRVAALLELGAGFNPEFTGRENILMNAAILGFNPDEIILHLEDIIDFSGIRDFIDQPVKTYSSGMYVRLAFSVAINVNPDILVIDEALSVGDGAFARRSFDRIMQMRDAGKTILFCSHSLFQIESLCKRAIWIDHGTVRLDDESARVITAYQAFLDKDFSKSPSGNNTADQNIPDPVIDQPAIPTGSARFEKIQLWVDETSTKQAVVASGQSNLILSVAFISDPSLPCPTVAMTVQTKDGRTITSAATWEDQFTIQRSSVGFGRILLKLDRFSLLRGDYLINVYLLCERGIHLYDAAEGIVNVQVTQSSRLQGYFSIPCRWENHAISSDD